MTLDNTELENSRFNRVRLSIEEDLKAIDMVVLKYVPEVVNMINSGVLRFTPFQRGVLSSNDISKYNSNNICKFIVNEPILAYFTVEVVLNTIKSDIHNKGPIFRTNRLVDKMFENRFSPQCFTRGSLDIIEVIENTYDITLSPKDIDIIDSAYDRILCKVTTYTSPFPNGIFDFDYTKNYVDLIYVEDIYCFRYKEASNFAEQGRRLKKNYG